MEQCCVIEQDILLSVLSTGLTRGGGNVTI